MVAEDCASSIRTVDFGVSAVTANGQGDPLKQRVIGDCFIEAPPSGSGPYGKHELHGEQSLAKGVCIYHVESHNMKPEVQKPSQSPKAVPDGPVRII